MNTAKTPCTQTDQRGISLIVVMVILLLSSLLILGSTRTNWLNESLISNESDYQRAYAAAEALISDAETDIRGVLIGGAVCQAGPTFQGCRERFNSRPFYPETDADLDDGILNINTPLPPAIPCRQGICIPATEATLGANWWNVNMPAMIANVRTVNSLAATYGEFTGAQVANTGNPLLGPNAAGVYSSWYWVEVLRYNHTTQSSLGLAVPAIEYPFVYRITAIARGTKPGTQVVLRSIFVPSEWL